MKTRTIYEVYEYGEGTKFESTKKSEAIKEGRKLERKGLSIAVKKWVLCNNFKPLNKVFGITFGSNNEKWVEVENNYLDKEVI